MTPLVLLVGFLGAGKTTYLRQLLPILLAQKLDPHVVINDYQNARIDAELLQNLVESIVPISGNCICCGSREELLATLENFNHQPNRLLIVETNGTTDSEELIELLSLESKLNRFTLPIQVSIIDGQRWQKRFWHNALELEQARTANYLFISREDEIDAKRAKHLNESFEKQGITGTVANPEKLACELVSIASQVGRFATRDMVANPSCCDCGQFHDSHNTNHNIHTHNAYHFASLQIDLPATVTRNALEQFLTTLPKEVIRAKGLVRLTESPEEYHVFQKVEHTVQLLPIGRNNRISHPVAVLIGPNLPEEIIGANVAKFLTARSN